MIGAAHTRTRRVLWMLWMLQELRSHHDHITASPRLAEVRAVNRGGRVPVLMVDGMAISDSTAILPFLADRTGRLTHPAGTIERAEGAKFAITGPRLANNPEIMCTRPACQRAMAQGA